MLCSFNFSHKNEMVGVQHAYSTPAVLPTHPACWEKGFSFTFKIYHLSENSVDGKILNMSSKEKLAQLLELFVNLLPGMLWY